MQNLFCNNSSGDVIYTNHILQYFSVYERDSFFLKFESFRRRSRKRKEKNEIFLAKIDEQNHEDSDAVDGIELRDEDQNVSIVMKMKILKYILLL